jgi:hypothetical protein
MFFPKEKLVYDIRTTRAERPRGCRVKDNTWEKSNSRAKIGDESPKAGPSYGKPSLAVTY